MSCGCKQAKRVAGNIAKGAVSLPQVILRPAPVEVIKERGAVCDTCEHKKRGHQAFCGHPIWGDADGGCGCPLAAKRRHPKKTCEKWKR